MKYESNMEICRNKKSKQDVNESAIQYKHKIITIHLLCVLEYLQLLITKVTYNVQNIL